jgi:Ca2+:H+ antiporter
LVAEFSHQPLAIFLTSVLAIIPLAGLIGQATDQLAMRVGPRLGGLLNATFGNLTELIVGVFLVAAGDFEIVKATLIGSIIGNLLLVLGISFLVGGIGRDEQQFNTRAVGIHVASLVLAVGGIGIPAVANVGAHLSSVHAEITSLGVAGTLILLYLAALVFMQFSHVHLFGTAGPDGRAEWSTRLALTVLLGAALLVGLESELLVSSLHPALKALHLSPFFVGLILIPIIGNAAEHSSAVFFALRDRLDITLEIAVGSSSQVALFVAPMLVFISLIVGRPMDFFFTSFEVGAVAIATVIVSLLSRDGRSNWLEGLQLIGVYAVIGFAAFFL